MPVELGNVPALEAIDNIRSKLAIPTKTWDEHLSLPRAKAFTVAGATKIDLLNDLQRDISQALENGDSIGSFRKNFDSTVQKHGWTYKGKRGWRTRVIYDNNLRSSHMAGRWEQIQRTKKTRPYLVYMTVGDSRVRAQHREWHHTALPIDDPFWDTHYPPNGWGCRCTIITANDRMLDRLGITVSDSPAIKSTERISQTTGETYGDVPVGIDVGWDNNVGKQWMGPDSVFGEKLMELPIDVRRAALANDGLQFQNMSKSFSIWAARLLREKARTENKLHTAGWLQDDLINALTERGIKPTTATIAISDARLRRMRRDSKKKTGKELPIEVLYNIPEQIKNARAVVKDNRGGLLFVLPHDLEDKVGKMVIEVNFSDRGETTNNIRSAGKVNIRDLQNKGAYELLVGKLT